MTTLPIPTSFLRRFLIAWATCLITTGLATAESPNPLPKLTTFQLQDQFGTNHTFAFPRSRPLLLLVGDRKGSEEIDPWVEPLKKRWSHVADIQGIADVQGAPRFLRKRIIDAIRETRPKPLLLDFDGKVTDSLPLKKKTANVFVVAPDGTVRAHVNGPFPNQPATDPRLATLGQALPE